MLGATEYQQAIILCGGAPNPALEYIEQIQSHYESTLYIGVDHGCIVLMDKGYPLNYAIGDFDSVSAEEVERIEKYAQKFIKHASMKDDTDMELALSLAMELNRQADYYILGAIGTGTGRLDHLLSNLWLAHQPRFSNGIGQTHFVERNHHIEFYQPGKHEIPPLMEPDYISVISLTPIKQLEIENAKYNLKPTNYTHPRALISNEFMDKEQPVTLSFTEGLVMVMWVNEV